MPNVVQTIVEFTPFQKRVIAFLQMMKFVEGAKLTDEESRLVIEEKWVDFFVALEARGVEVPFE